MEMNCNDKAVSSSKSRIARRFINYVTSRQVGERTSTQTAMFDTLTRKATFASDFFFKPEDLLKW